MGEYDPHLQLGVRNVVWHRVPYCGILYWISDRQKRSEIEAFHQFARLHPWHVDPPKSGIDLVVMIYRIADLEVNGRRFVSHDVGLRGHATKAAIRRQEVEYLVDARLETVLRRSIVTHDK